MTGPHTRPGYTTAAPEWGFVGVGGIKVTVKLEGVFLLRGPCSLKVVEGSVEALGGRLGEGEFVVVPAGRSIALRSEGARVEVSGCEPEAWNPEGYGRFEEAASHAGSSGRVVLVGPTDSGKSTLAAWILNRWGGGWLLEADIGQNEVFAPGFEALTRPLQRVVVPGFLESFDKPRPCFVGSFTPSAAESKYLACAASLSRRAEGRLVVDTDGWVQRWGGLYSKAALAAATRAELVISLGLAKGSCSVLEDVSGVEVLCLSKLVEGSEKSREERSLHRDRLLARRLIGAKEWRLSLDEVEVRGAPVLHGTPIPLEEARNIEPSAVYAEAQEGGVAVVAKGRPLGRSGVRFVRLGWEKGLLAAVHAKGEVELAVILSVDYRARKITIASRVESKPTVIEAGLVRVDYEALSGSIPLG